MNNDQYNIPFFVEEDYKIYNHYIENDTRHIYIKSLRKNTTCPYCGAEVDDFHSTYDRIIKDTPIHNQEVILHVKSYKYYCNNDNCNCKIFTEELPFAAVGQVRTYALNAFILGVSMFLSSEGASKVLSLLGITVSNDTIQRMYNKLHFEDNHDVEAVGIDDVAIRKGHTYATAIYDLDNHNMIALLDGRDGETLKEWLKNHKKIRLVARDRASSYASAINEILPECTQVADRFHLIQNIIDRLKDVFYAEMPKNIFIKNSESDNTFEILDVEPKKESVLPTIDESLLETLDYDNSEPIDIDGNPIEYDNKKRDLSSPQYIRHAQSRKEKQELIREIQKRWESLEKKKVKIIAKEFEISFATAKKYIKLTEEEIEQMDQPRNYKKRKTIMDDYINIIYKMLKDNHDINIIFNYIINKGYTGSFRSLLNYINLIGKNNFPDYGEFINWNSINKIQYPTDIIVIKRCDILKYIFTKDPKKEKDKIIDKHFGLLKDKYPIINEVQVIYDEFHSTIMGDDTNELDKFLKKYKGSKIDGLCNGIKKDINAVRNAISLTTSSGFVEGNNNKFKLIKRIVYGRTKLVNLSQKCFLAFSSKVENFKLSDLAKQLGCRNRIN